MTGASELLQLMDYRRRVAESYSRARSATDPVDAWHRWVRERDDLFRTHPQSPIPRGGREKFDGLRYFEYDPAFRVTGRVRPVERSRLVIHTSGDHAYEFIRFAEVSFNLAEQDLTLGMYWLDSYAGGLFISLRDATSGRQTYGACRYLIDSAKGADLGMSEDGGLVLDFNFAYNPSCAYDPRWVCPLAPPDNHLKVAVTAGERSLDGKF